MSEHLVILTHFLCFEGKKKQNCPALMALVCLQGPHSVFSLCSGHPSHKLLVGGGTHLSPLLRLNLEDGRTLHCACSILQPSGYDQTAFYSTLFMTLGCGSELNINCGIDKPQYTHVALLFFLENKAWVEIE